MRIFITLAALLFVCHSTRPMAEDKPIFDEPFSQQQQLSTQSELSQSWGNYFCIYAKAASRSIQSSLGINDEQILYEEKENSAQIIATYQANTTQGVNNHKITQQYFHRHAIANRIGELLARKLSQFCINYDNAENKVSFLIEHNNEWRNITEKDIEHANFLVTDYPKELLPPKTVTILENRYRKINEIMQAIQNPNAIDEDKK